jgi:hypothetical protein
MLIVQSLFSGAFVHGLPVKGLGVRLGDTSN